MKINIWRVNIILDRGNECSGHIEGEWFDSRNTKKRYSDRHADNVIWMVDTLSVGKWRVSMRKQVVY